MEIEHHAGPRRRKRLALRRAIRGLAGAAVEGLRSSNDQWSNDERRRARTLSDGLADELEELAGRRAPPAFEPALGAATLMFEQHPLQAGELVAMALDAARATSALVEQGEATLEAAEAPVAALCRDQILPRVVQRLVADASLIEDLAGGAPATSQARQVVVGRNGCMPIPPAFRTALGIEVGDLVMVELGHGELRVRPTAAPA